MEKEARILKKNKEVYGKVGGKEKEMKNGVIICVLKNADKLP